QNPKTPKPQNPFLENKLVFWIKRNKENTMVKSSHVVLLLLLVHAFQYVRGVMQVRNISTLYIKGEEALRLALDDYFQGESVTYTVAGTTDNIRFESGFAELWSGSYLAEDTELQYASSVLIRNYNLNESHVFAVMFANRDIQEFVLTRNPDGTITLAAGDADKTFESSRTCALSSNELTGRYMIVARCWNATLKTYETFAKRTGGGMTFQRWDETAMEQEDKLNPSIRYSEDTSVVLSTDRTEERIYLYASSTDPKRKMYYLKTQLFSLKDYTLIDNFTDLAFIHEQSQSDPYVLSLLLHRRRFLYIYHQPGYVGMSTQLANLSLPLEYDALYYDPKSDPATVYAYSKRSQPITIARIDIGDRFWPHIVRSYSSNFSGECKNVSLVVSKSFVVATASGCTGSLPTAVLAFNKDLVAQIPVGEYNASFLTIHLLYYEQDTFLQVQDSALRVVRLNQRSLKISTLGAEPKARVDSPVAVTARDRMSSLTVTFTVTLLPPFYDLSYENPNKPRHFTLLAGDWCASSTNDYIIGNDEEYRLAKSDPNLTVSLDRKLSDLPSPGRRHRNSVATREARNEQCLLRGEFEIPVGKDRKLFVQDDRFVLYHCASERLCTRERVIRLFREAESHCVVNNKLANTARGGSYLLYKERYLIFVTATSEKGKRLNVLDLTKPNLNNYYAVANLEDSGDLDINCYFVDVFNEADPPEIIITSSETPKIYYEFDFNVRTFMSVFAKDSDQQVANHTVELQHASGRTVRLELRVISKNMPITRRKGSLTVKHEYRQLDETRTIDLGKFVSGYNVSFVPVVDGAYFYDYSKVHVHQQTTYLKEIVNTAYNWTINMVASSPDYPLITLSTSDMLNVSFYTKISANHLDQDNPAYRIVVPKQSFTILGIGPVISFEGVSVLPLYAYDKSASGGYIMKFIVLTHHSFLLPSLPVSLRIRAMCYNPTTQHLYLLEELDHKWRYSNKVFLESSQTFDRRLNTFAAVIDYAYAGFSAPWQVTTIYYGGGNDVYLGVKDFGVVKLLDGEEHVEVKERLNMTWSLLEPRFSVLSLAHFNTTNATYVFGTTENEVFALLSFQGRLWFLDSYMRMSGYRILGHIALHENTLAVTMSRESQSTRAVHIIVFYNFNSAKGRLEMKYVLSAEGKPLGVNFVGKAANTLYVAVSSARGISMYKLVLSPEIILTPELGEQDVSVECENSLSREYFLIHYRPKEIQDKYENVRRFVVPIVCSALAALAVVLTFVCVKRRCRKTEQNKSLTMELLK
ncbi:MAG: hypothetical protein P4M11_15015, partial [Candidatus Pacebacteria bacterium]|nr:hypothetical protein [Candidatus Paceibacterota bacterium]